MGRISGDETVKKAFGRRLKALRNRRGLTQQGLADLAHLNLSYIFRLEKGERNPTLLVLHDLAHVLKIRVRDLTDDA